jgi:hypothetical protein
LAIEKEFQKSAYALHFFKRRLCALIFDDLWGVRIIHPAVGLDDFLGENSKNGNAPCWEHILNWQIRGQFKWANYGTLCELANRGRAF